MLPGLVMAVVGMLLLTRIDQDTSYWALVFPAMVLMSVGLAGVFIPASSTALVGVGSHDAGVASAVLNTSQQIGGSLGTALLNTLFAGAVTAYFADNPPTSPGQAQQILPLAFIHGYHVAFFWGAVLLAGALLASIVVHQRAQGGHPRRRGPGRRAHRVRTRTGSGGSTGAGPAPPDPV